MSLSSMLDPQPHLPRTVLAAEHTGDHMSLDSPSAAPIGPSPSSSAQLNPPPPPSSTSTNPPILATPSISVDDKALPHVQSPMHPTMSSTTGLHGVDGKRARERERRIMPARLRRVSNLLAGSTIEDELYGTSAKLEGDILPPTAKFLLTTVEDGDHEPYQNPFLVQEEGYFSNPDVAKACRNRELIETPDFKTRDDTEMMGKTRTIRSEEDTSDAAYERRHRKPDNLEKKQRRLEKERLVRDRQKLKERIDQLKVADSRLLVPILTAREQQQKQTVTDGQPVAETASPRGAEGSYGSGKQNWTLDATQNLAKLESLRAELLEEAHETLKRYDALLTPTESLTPAPTKRGPEEGEGGQKPARSISLSGAFANKKGGASGNKSFYTSSANSTPSTTVKRANSRKRKSGSPGEGSNSKRLSLVTDTPKSPIPFTEEDGTVRAENTYANIHARTSGGRFAPKSALSGKPGSTSKINTKARWKAGEGGQEKPKRRRSSAAKARGKETSSASSAAVASTSKVATANSDSSAGDSKPRRVKLILNKRGKGGGVGGEGSSSTSSSALSTPVLDRIASGRGGQEVELESDSVTPQRAVRSALTLEEAQALLAKAMEDDEDEE